MNKLLSLPPNLVDYFHEIEKVDPEEYFCTSDPWGKRLGSGGGTTWLLDACREKENCGNNKKYITLALGSGLEEDGLQPLRFQPWRGSETDVKNRESNA